jgi:hypothetical protein
MRHLITIAVLWTLTKIVRTQFRLTMFSVRVSTKLAQWALDIARWEKRGSNSRPKWTKRPDIVAPYGRWPDGTPKNAEDLD